jgi:hypothetical protein
MQREIDHARLLGQLPNGTRVYRFPVDIDANDSRLLSTQRIRVYVDAANARDAARYVQDELATRPETEITAYGPKGGAHRVYTGWHSAVANAMQAEWRAKQLRLPLSLNVNTEAA